MPTPYSQKTPWDFAVHVNEVDGYHLLPMYYERCGYTISLEGFDYINDHGMLEVEIFRNVCRIIRPFVGWAICVKESFASKEYIKSKCDNWLRGGPWDDFDEPAAQTQLGRPRVQEDAAKDYNHLYPDGHNGETWKTVMYTIKEATGNKYSIDSVKRGLGQK